MHMTTNKPRTRVRKKKKKYTYEEAYQNVKQSLAKLDQLRTLTSKLTKEKK